LALLQGDTQSRRLPPVRCASAGAERREGGLCADPAYVVIPQEKKKKKRSEFCTLAFDGDVRIAIVAMFDVAWSW
jgi:hypothetical protein